MKNLSQKFSNGEFLQVISNKTWVLISDKMSEQKCLLMNNFIPSDNLFKLIGFSIASEIIMKTALASKIVLRMKICP
jgi:hypothetical protein